MPLNVESPQEILQRLYAEATAKAHWATTSPEQATIRLAYHALNYLTSNHRESFFNHLSKHATFTESQRFRFSTPPLSEAQLEARMAAFTKQSAPSASRPKRKPTTKPRRKA